MIVQNEPPKVDVGTDQTADEGETVRFSGSYVDPGVLDSHTIVWDFGDGIRAVNTVAPQHVYKNDGDFTVTLTVTDNDGGVGFDSLVVRVVNKAPIVQIEE